METARRSSFLSGLPKVNYWLCTLFSVCALRLLLGCLAWEPGSYIESLSSFLADFQERSGYSSPLNLAFKSPQQIFLSNKIRKINPRVDADSLAAVIIRESRLLGFDPLVTASLIKSESTFNRLAVSPKGAIGLMQLLPTTASYISKRAGLNWNGVQALYSPAGNIRLGLLYLSYLLERFNGNWDLALGAYNWGPGNLNKSLARGTRVAAPVRRYIHVINNTHGLWEREFSKGELL